MAKSTVSKLTPAEKPKEIEHPIKDTSIIGERLFEIGVHLEDIASLLYQNQDHLGNTGLILGVENLIDHFATQIQMMGNKLKD